MQMRSGCISRAAGFADFFFRLHRRAQLDGDFIAMRIAREDAAAEINFDHFTITGDPSGPRYRAGACSPNRIALFVGDIDAGMFFLPVRMFWVRMLWVFAVAIAGRRSTVQGYGTPIF